MRLAVGRTDADGTFVLTERFKHRGMKDLYVEVSRGGGYSYGQSRQLHVKVTRR